MAAPTAPAVAPAAAAELLAEPNAIIRVGQFGGHGQDARIIARAAISRVSLRPTISTSEPAARMHSDLQALRYS
jgi:hypothetical protein